MDVSLLFLLAWHVGLIILVLATLVTVCYVLIPHPTKMSLIGTHVVVTGGSRGIGKAIAKEAVLEGANVTLIARNPDKLEEVREELQSLLAPSSTLKVQWFSLDLTTADQNELNDVIIKAESRIGRSVDVLINNCGGSITATFDDLSLSAFDAQMKINFLSAVACTKAVMPSMKQNRSGRIVFVSSMAGQIGLFGYTAYSASKFALRGLAEALQMELRPHNICLSLAFPPDTNTEGFAAEQATMPPETTAISQEAGLWEPRDIAQEIIKGTKRGNFFISFGLDGWMLSRITAGMATVTSAIEAVEQILFVGLFRLAALFYIWKFNGIVSKLHKMKRS